MSLRELRAAAQLTQDELSERSGVSQALISQLERGASSNPGVSTLRKLADALGVPVERVLAAVMGEVA